MTFSLLIPVCNYDIVALVHGMKNCIGIFPEFLEIIIGDDGSSTEYHSKYKSLEGNGVRIIRSKKNIGRSAIRNKLALEAKGDFLLFIDADTMFPSTAEAFLKNWIEAMPLARVISGGILYHQSPIEDPDKMLRWKYGINYEQRKASLRNKHPHAGFSSFNFIIDRTIFSTLRFNEELKQYGHEDTLFSYQLKKAEINILHIDNGLFHEGLETNSEFLHKTKQGLENLSRLYDRVTDKRAFISSVRMLRLYDKLRLIRVRLILVAILVRFRERMEIRIDSANPPMWLFHFYKVCIFCAYREIHRRRKRILPVILPESIDL